MASKKRDHLVATALDLFTQHGYRATGIDTILAESGVAKMTLYNHFKSKDELIIAALKKRDDEFMQWLGDAIKRYIPQQQGDPRTHKLLSLFDALHEWINSEAFYGCNFISASVEFKDEDDPVHIAAGAFKKLKLGVLQELLSELELENPAGIARQIHMIIEGAIVMAVTIGEKNSALIGKKTALQILQANL
ncbi:Transcriptional regulator, AcrR family [hydrothermal vent metagenome]|uniref:Transcriptional regulator, AcrR family n=1 Tax=hydrothermal vent metagenome TaxID=652676 RepID=A0A3B0XV31_9ZZZZ